MAWKKAELLPALKELRDRTDELMGLLDQEEDGFDVAPESSWSFPYTPESGSCAASFRIASETALRVLLNPVQYVFECLTGTSETKALVALVQSGAPDRLGKQETVSIDELASRCKAVPDRLRAVVRISARLGILQETKPLSDVWMHTSHSLVLRKDSSAPIWAMTSWSQAFVAKIMDKVPELVLQENAGKTGVELAYGKASVFEILSEPQNAHLSTYFNLTMKASSPFMAGGVADDYPWEQFGRDATVVDVGGGIGSQMIVVAKKHLKMQFVVQDLEHVCQGGRKFWQTQIPDDMSRRVHFQAHDFYTPQPAELPNNLRPSVYWMRWILHDWDDGKAIKILQALRDSVQPGAKLLLGEFVVTEHLSKVAAQWMLSMLLYGGIERTEREYGVLLAASGWKITKLYKTRSPLDIIECEAI